MAVSLATRGVCSDLGVSGGSGHDHPVLPRGQPHPGREHLRLRLHGLRHQHGPALGAGVVCGYRGGF